MNHLKQTPPERFAFTLLSLDDFKALQDKSDGLVETKSLKEQLRAGDHHQLKELGIGKQKVSEGDLVAVIGFLVSDKLSGSAGKTQIRAASSESVNCRLTGQQNNDFHLTVAQQAGLPETSGIVVEMIPQHRPINWTKSNLDRVLRDGQEVLVVGGLFYDYEHNVNDDPEHLQGNQPARFSLWEIHPVTAFLTCPKAKTCDPSVESQWQALGGEQLLPAIFPTHKGPDGPHQGGDTSMNGGFAQMVNDCLLFVVLLILLSLWIVVRDASLAIRIREIMLPILRNKIER